MFFLSVYTLLHTLQILSTITVPEEKVMWIHFFHDMLTWTVKKKKKI